MSWKSPREAYRERRIKILCRIMEEFWKEVGILDYANNFKYSRLENEWRRPISEIERQTRRQTRRQEYLDTVGRIEREDLVT